MKQIYQPDSPVSPITPRYSPIFPILNTDMLFNVETTSETTISSSNVMDIVQLIKIDLGITISD
jgi:hypothetical protein